MRMLLPRLEANGWDYRLLTVRPDQCDFELDDQLRVISRYDESKKSEAGAIPKRLSGLFGINNIGYRSFFSLLISGFKILRKERCTLVFFSTTSFFTLLLGPIWKRLLGVAYVIDIQDMIYTDFYDDKPRSEWPKKHGISKYLNRWLERVTVQRAAGVVTVSEDYCRQLNSRYGARESLACQVLPFGTSVSDFKTLAMSCDRSAKSSQTLIVRYLGRVTRSMLSSVDLLLTALSRIQVTVSCEFIGTSYYLSADDTGIVGHRAATAFRDLEVSENPNRIGFVDNLKSMLSADVLVVLGSEDSAYEPSKAYACLATGNPVILASPEENQLTEKMSGIAGVHVLTGEVTHDDVVAIEQLLTLDTSGLFAQRSAVVEQFDATSNARKLCVFFDEVSGGA